MGPLQCCNPLNRNSCPKNDRRNTPSQNPPVPHAGPPIEFSVDEYGATSHGTVLYSIEPRLTCRGPGPIQARPFRYPFEPVDSVKQLVNVL